MIDSASALKLRKIKALAMDVDGVLTDGGMYYSERGDELKRFNTRDGQGIELLMKNGFLIAIITRENTKIVDRRARKLNVRNIFQGVEDKVECIKEFAEKNNLKLNEIAYIGDDINDLDVLESVGFAVAVNDADRKVKEASDHITNGKGGYGAVREVCELILEHARREISSKN